MNVNIPGVIQVPGLTPVEGHGLVHGRGEREPDIASMGDAFLPWPNVPTVPDVNVIRAPQSIAVLDHSHDLPQGRRVHMQRYVIADGPSRAQKTITRLRPKSALGI